RLLFVFFFSSRRRHTRFSRDWSSDVCSSDLRLRPRTARLHSRRERRDRLRLTLSKGTHVGTPAKRELHLGYMYWLNGTHWGGWRLPEAPTANAFELDYAARAAKLVEDAKFDFFFLGDTLPGDIYKEHWGTTHNAGRLEPFTLASQLALQTSRIGLVVTAHPTYYEPYIL